MPEVRLAAGALLALACSLPSFAAGERELFAAHCASCHNDKAPVSDFRIGALGEHPEPATLPLWTKSLTFVQTKYMPPPQTSNLSAEDRRRLVSYLSEGVRGYERRGAGSSKLAPRRLNNREIANGLRDVLEIEDVGTHHPLANLLGDTLEEGFDTDAEALAVSQFHLEQYIEAFRKVIDATILTGPRPKTRRYQVAAADMFMNSLSQRGGEGRNNRTPESIEFLDPRQSVYFTNFAAAPDTGRYRIKIRATGVDRGIYDAAATGIYHDDPIRLRVHLGDRVKMFDLLDNEVTEIELDEWIAAGTRLELSYPTDGLRFRGNSNFKFQFAIGHDYIKRTDPELYAAVLREKLPQAPARTAKSPGHWSHWTDNWQGARPRLLSAEIEGPLYESWPPKRQIALLGAEPVAEHAAAILRPIAERAWRRSVQEDELEPIARLVQTRAQKGGGTEHVEALKEGVVAILASPSFLLVNPGVGHPSDRFATKLALFVGSTIPDQDFRATVADDRLESFDAVRAEIQRRLGQQEADAFLSQFPYSWLELDQISFMAPDPDRFPLYSRKNLSEDMINEALRFFRHIVENNLPVPELLAADYSFINADLAQVYGVDDVPQDSKLRKYTFADGRRGGLLGMGAFLTSTADSLSTSPIHRAVFVMEKLLGIRPAPPPGDVEITEPDVRQAKTIKEILAAHASEPTCASCHRTIDPYGYAFENFDPVGVWREAYTSQIERRPPRARLLKILAEDKRRAAEGLPPVPRPWENEPIPVDSAAQFPDGSEYQDIVDYRRLLANDENRDRFVRCFITKLLTYANGAEPENDAELDKILARSAENDYRIVDTIAAVVHSPPFREE